MMKCEHIYFMLSGEFRKQRKVSVCVCILVKQNIRFWNFKALSLTSSLKTKMVTNEDQW